MLLSASFELTFRSSNIIPIKDNDLTTRKFFAPANDPFSTAKKIQEIVNIIHSKDLHLRHNIYLCPLSTKAQLVGYAYYWWKEGRHETHRGMVNIVLPMCTSYKRETSIVLPEGLENGKYVATIVIDYGNDTNIEMAELTFTYEK